MFPDLWGRSQSSCVARCSQIFGGGCSWCSHGSWVMYDRDLIYDSWFVVCAWRNYSTYKYTLVVVSGGLRCLVTLDLHGEGGARDVQWWCFAWQAHVMLHRQRMLRRCVKLPTTSLMCKAVRVDDEERLSSSVSLCRSQVTRVVQADLLDN